MNFAIWEAIQVTRPVNVFKRIWSAVEPITQNTHSRVAMMKKCEYKREIKSYIICSPLSLASMSWWRWRNECIYSGIYLSDLLTWSTRVPKMSQTCPRRTNIYAKAENFQSVNFKHHINIAIILCHRTQSDVSKCYSVEGRHQRPLSQVMMCTCYKLLHVLFTFKWICYP